MKFKFFVFSILFHFILFFSFSSFSPPNNKQVKIEKTSNIPVNFTKPVTESKKQISKKVTEKNRKKTKTSKPPKKIKAITKVEKKKVDTKVKKKSKKTTLPPLVTKKKEIISKEKPIVNKKTSEIETDQKNNNTNNKIVASKDGDLIKLSNGEFALKNQRVQGIDIVINNEISPKYPEIALKMGYRKGFKVKVKFLVDKNGHVKDIKFYTNSKYGFENSVEEALKRWKFEPIIYKGSSTSTYFYKIFTFEATN